MLIFFRAHAQSAIFRTVSDYDIGFVFLHEQYLPLADRRGRDASPGGVARFEVVLDYIEDACDGLIEAISTLPTAAHDARLAKETAPQEKGRKPLLDKGFRPLAKLTPTPNYLRVSTCSSGP